MKSILILLLTFFSAFPAAAQNPDKNIEQQYKDAGIKDAEILQKVYDKLHKPLYQQAYDDYLQDLDYIAETALLPTTKPCIATCWPATATKNLSIRKPKPTGTNFLTFIKISIKSPHKL